MAKMGRPKKNIDQKEFEKLCAMQCTLEEIFCIRDGQKLTYDEVFGE